MEEAERKVAELEELNAREGERGEPAPQQPVFDEEAAWAPPPESNDDVSGEIWPSGAEWAPLPDDEEDEAEVPAAPMQLDGGQEPEMTIREIVL